MTRTQSRNDCDTAFGDGVIPFAAQDFNAIGTTTFTRNAKGDVSWNQPQSQTVTYIASLSSLLYRLGLLDLTYNQFGSASATPGTTPAGVSGPPPYVTSGGIPVWLNPQIANRPKGIAFLDFTLAYLVGTTNLTSQSFGLSKTVCKNAIALAITDIIAPGTNGLSVVAAATPYVTKVPVSGANQLFQIADDTDYTVELTVVTPASSTYRLYGGWLHVTYDFN